MSGTPWVTWMLLGITVLVSWQAFGNRRLMDRLMFWPPAIRRQRQYDRFLGHGFIHADGMHLLFNMITLYFFGTAVEPVFSAIIGPLGFLGFYLSALVVAILPSWLRHRDDPGFRSLGASGAVAAVLFGYILFAPWSLIFVFFVPVPAIVFAVLYVGYSFWMDRRGGDRINHGAHLAGAIYGVLFTLLMSPRVGSHFLEQLGSPSFL
ncbi:MAG: rhomboid family intramembrane serine protease [Pseudoxanthomonas suwonensis]|nr:rhomboid family intramembrane serine protease [Pseudoxanthomonas suwonensis]